MYQIYLIPGLGIDERIFINLNLDRRFSQTVIRWITPEPRETLPHYARRLAQQLPDTNNFVLVGLSFGGIMAIELAKFRQPALTIIISSIKTRDELPWYFKASGWLKLPAFLPVHWGKYFVGLQTYFFGAKTAQEAKLLHQIIQEINIPYLRWSLTQITNWTNTELIPGLVHLHGTHDRIFPVKYLRNYTAIANGEHLMILSQGPYLRTLIEAELDKLPPLNTEE
jgi:pimeloyl-ACP methyl ester carboxylesterase